MLTVFLSSTSKDLEPYRKAAIDVCMRLGLRPIAMEYFNAMAAGASEGSKSQLDNADLYVGIYAHRYGYIEDANDGRSVTEIEFDYAQERGLDRICFLVDPQWPWPPEHVDYINYDKLQAFKNKVNKLIHGQFKSVDNFSALLADALVNWMGGLQGRTDRGSAVLATHPDDLIEMPDKLIGRDTMLTDVRALLEHHNRVLLQGFGGMGKTALAATVAANWIKDGKGNVLWLKAGSAESDPLFEALARPFNAQQAIANQTGDAKTKALRDLLRGKATLLVLDDCWNTKALFDLLKAIPSDIALLVTSRQRYPLPQIRVVDKLAPSDALALLTHYSQRDLRLDSKASVLCSLLGNHAFAIEIAGKTLKAQGWTVDDLLQQIQDSPEKMTMPLEASETGRENVAKLLDVSLQALDTETKSIFFAFGAFFASRITPEMLQIYFDNKKNLFGVPSTLERETIETGLATLHLHGLAEIIDANEKQVTSYRIHDLAYSYAKSQNDIQQHEQALQACLIFIERYNSPSSSNFAALRPELDDLLGAATWALTNGHLESVKKIANSLYWGSEILSAESFSDPTITNKLLKLFEQAAAAAGKDADYQEQSQYLGNLGSAYASIGQIEEAVAYYEQALAIKREIGDRRGEGSDLSNLAKAYSDLGQIEKAIPYYEQALAIKREIGNRRGEGSDLGNLGNAYSAIGEASKAVTYYEQGLEIAREIGDRRGEMLRLVNLGRVVSEIGSLGQAKQYYEKSFALAREIGDRTAIGNILGNLGNTSVALRQFEEAKEYYLQAIQIAKDSGDKLSEGNWLTNLGTVYSEKGDNSRSQEYLLDALDIYKSLGVKNLILEVERRIDTIRSKNTFPSIKPLSEPLKEISPNLRIFISYRRDDCKWVAGWLHHVLSDHFGEDQIFMDIRGIIAGDNFVEAIENALSMCHIMIVVIGKRWLNIKDKNGRKRLDNPTDFVRLEIATALKRGIRVIPLLVDSASIPHPDDLPEDLQVLSYRQGILTDEKRFRNDIKDLIVIIEKNLESIIRASEA